MEKINIAEILKDCPTGMELDCAVFDNVYFNKVDNHLEFPIECYILCGERKLTILFTKYGEYSILSGAKCVIFPKGKTTWEGFVPPCEFKDGDVLFVDCSDDDEDKSYQYIFILNKPEFLGKWHSYCMLDGVGNFQSHETYLTEEEYHPRFATEEEKTKLFDAIKANGYKWNPETKTLEKVIQPKFKVGDKIIKRNSIENSWIVSSVSSEYYGLKTRNNSECIGILSIAEQDEYDLIPTKFDINTLVPFDSRVLVRYNKGNKWCGSFFSHIDGNLHSHCYKYVTVAGKSYPMCIPYEGNEHLLGTTNDCDEYYKNWQVMTREEQINLYLKERNIPITSLEANSIIEGIKWADEHPNLCKEEQVGMNELGMMWQKQALIKKACEWLENIDFASEYFYDGEGFFDNAILVEEFKKANDINNEIIDKEMKISDIVLKRYTAEKGKSLKWYEWVMNPNTREPEKVLRYAEYTAEIDTNRLDGDVMEIPCEEYKEWWDNNCHCLGLTGL